MLVMTVIRILLIRQSFPESSRNSRNCKGTCEIRCDLVQKSHIWTTTISPA